MERIWTLLQCITPSSELPHSLTHQYLVHRAVRWRLTYSFHRCLSPMEKWHWSGSTGTAWQGLASRRYPGSFLHSPQSCSLWVNRELQLLSLQCQSHYWCYRSKSANSTASVVIPKNVSKNIRRTVTLGQYGAKDNMNEFRPVDKTMSWGLSSDPNFVLTGSHLVPLT